MQQFRWVSRELFWVEEKPIPEGYPVYDSIYVIFLEWLNFRDGG